MSAEGGAGLAADQFQKAMEECREVRLGIAPLFEPIARALADLGAQYSTQELAVLRDFISRFHQGAWDEIRKLREGGRHADSAKGSRPTEST
jgi:hypothetical protein